MAAELGERCIFSTSGFWYASGLRGILKLVVVVGVPEVHGWSSYPPGADSRRPFPSVLFAYFPFLPLFPVTVVSLQREQLVFVALACMVRQSPILLPLPTTSSAAKVVLASCWTRHHLVCCCYSLCNPVHSLLGAQMDRSLRCSAILCRGAFFPLQLWISN